MARLVIELSAGWQCRCLVTAPKTAPRLVRRSAYCGTAIEQGDGQEQDREQLDRLDVPKHGHDHDDQGEADRCAAREGQDDRARAHDRDPVGGQLEHAGRSLQAWNSARGTSISMIWA